MKLKIITFGLLYLLASSASAAVIYVKPSGDDTAGCTTWVDACKTISGAVSKSASGDKIHIAKGVYKINNISISNKDLKFVGGFIEGSSIREGDKFDTILSGDIDNNDIVDARGVAASHSNIVGSNAPRGFVLSSGNFEFDSMAFTGFRGADTGDNHGIVIFYGDSTKVDNSLKLTNVAVVGNRSPSMGAVMMYIISPNKGEFVLSDSYFEGNLGDSGSAVTLHNNITKAVIENSVFNNNTAQDIGQGWNRATAAVYIQTSAFASEDDLIIRNSIFSNNTAENGAGAVYSNSPITISNTSFSNNKVLNAKDDTPVAGDKCAGAVVVSGKKLVLEYSTFYQNTAPAACAGGVRANIGTANSVSMLANLILMNTPNNIFTANSVISDKGYNIFGENTVSGVVGSFTRHATSIVPSVASAAIVKGAGNFGGRGESVRIIKNGLAHNAVPNDGIPFYGVGKSVEAPFVTMKQARGALSREDYDAGNYYFDLGGSYDVNNNFAYVEGSDSGKKFSSDVKKNGYVRRVGSVAPAGAIQSIFEDSSNWDRGEVGFCAGGINTDARGLPRADRVKTEDPVSDCDIGAFEYNDYYQVDCWNEDGDRPENNIKSASMTWCMGADDLKNPKAIIENMGTFAWYWSLALLGVFFIRRKLV